MGSGIGISVVKKDTSRYYASIYSEEFGEVLSVGDGRSIAQAISKAISGVSGLTESERKAATFVSYSEEICEGDEWLPSRRSSCSTTIEGWSFNRAERIANALLEARS